LQNKANRFSETEAQSYPEILSKERPLPNPLERRGSIGLEDSKNLFFVENPFSVCTPQSPSHLWEDRVGLPKNVPQHIFCGANLSANLCTILLNLNVLLGKILY